MAFDSVIHRVLYIPGGAGFLPSTIFHWIAANLLVFGYVFNLLFSRKLPLLKHTLAHPSASSTHKKQVNWERLRPCRWDFNASQSEIWVVVDVMMTCGMQIIHNHHVSTIHVFPAYGGILGEQTARSARVLSFRGTHPHVPFELQTFCWSSYMENGHP